MTPHHTHPRNRITEIRINTREVFEQAFRRTLEVVKAIPEADPDLHGLSVDELGWANDQINKARSQVALTLNRLSKRIVHRPPSRTGRMRLSDFPGNLYHSCSGRVTSGGRHELYGRISSGGMVSLASGVEIGNRHGAGVIQAEPYYAVEWRCKTSLTMLLT